MTKEAEAKYNDTMIALKDCCVTLTEHYRAYKANIIECGTAKQLKEFEEFGKHIDSICDLANGRMIYKKTTLAGAIGTLMIIGPWCYMIWHLFK